MSVQKVSGHVLLENRDIYWRYKIQETLYIGKWGFSLLQSRHLEISHSSPNNHQLPHCIFLNLIDGLKSLPFQRWFWFWEKPEVTGHQIWAVGWLSHLGDLMFCKKTLHKMWCISVLVVMMKLPVHQLPIAVAFWIIWIVAVEECSRLMENLVQIRCSTCSFWVWQLYSTHAHSIASTTPTD